MPGLYDFSYVVKQWSVVNEHGTALPVCLMVGTDVLEPGDPFWAVNPLIVFPRTPWEAGASYEISITVQPARVDFTANTVLELLGTEIPIRWSFDVIDYFKPPPPPPPPLSFSPLVPGRLLESRSGGATVDAQANGIGLRGAGSVTELQVTGRHGVPADASAAVLNVTVTGAQGDGFVTVWPCGTARPNASSLNFTSGQTIPNAVITKIGAGGKVCLFTTAPTFLLADINGFYPAGSSFSPLVPGRLLESRSGGATVDGQANGIGLRGAGSVTELQVTGRHGVPADASAAVLNVTVTGAQGDGFVTVWPCGTAQPNASSLNFTSGQTIPNAVITKIGAGGKVCLFTTAPTFLLADINGFYPAGSSFSPLVPGRLLESRSGGATVDGQANGIGLRGAGSVTELQVTGRHGVPADASAAVLNVTVTGAQGDGFVTVWPCGTARPNASSLNFTSGQTIPNAVITKIGAGGKVCLFTTAPTFLLADINGYTN